MIFCARLRWSGFSGSSYPTEHTKWTGPTCSLGPRYARKTFLVEKGEGEIIVLKLAEVVPVDEAWLWRNGEAFRAVTERIEDAQKARLGELDQKAYEE